MPCQVLSERWSSEAPGWSSWPPRPGNHSATKLMIFRSRNTRKMAGRLENSVPKVLTQWCNSVEFVQSLAPYSANKSKRVEKRSWGALPEVLFPFKWKMSAPCVVFSRIDKSMAPSTMTWGNLQADVGFMGTSKYRYLLCQRWTMYQCMLMVYECLGLAVSSEPKLKKAWFQLSMPPCWQHYGRHCDAEVRIDNLSCHLQTYQPNVCNDVVDEARLPTS